MGEFFRRWRNKVGMVTVVMALVFVAGWVRSHARCDYIQLNGISWRYIVSSELGQLHFYRATTLEGDRFLTTSFFDYNGRLFYVSKGEDALRLYFVPYWSITIPLTLISLFLLLSKPRKSNQKKITEPIPEKLK